MSNTNRTINYVNKDFDSFKQSLIEYAKTYFPKTYNDFTPSHPGTMFIEMASYIGDVLSFYQDSQFQEMFTPYAKEKQNLYNLAYMMGYKPKVTTASSTELEIFQIIPSILSASLYIPDYRYSLILEAGASVKSNINNAEFIIKDKVDFSISSSYDPTFVTVYSINGSNPSFFLLKKTRQIYSGTEITTNFTIGNAGRFPSILLEDNNIIEITSIVDSDGNKWYEVPYLAQETIFEEVSNNFLNDPNFYTDESRTPNLLKLKKVQRRFTTRFKSETQLEISFGAGNSNNIDELIIPNPDKVGIGLPNGISKLGTAYDPSNFLYTSTYGIAPTNTTLTVKYLKGGGFQDNVPANSITNINNAISNFKINNLDPVLSNTILNSLAISNPSGSIGGGLGDSEEDLRNNIMSSFSTQLRAVTLNDYIIRTYNLPSKFGVISKAYATQEQADNSSIITLYILSQNTDKTLTNCSSVTKQNLKTYLSQFKLLTDAVEIKDAFIINIGVNFDIVVLPNFNSQELIIKCIETIKNYFDITKRQINQPILLSELFVLLDKVNGVQTVKDIQIYNKNDESLGYSKYGYDINGATVNRVIYPSLDPSIFEIKFPNIDILGRSSGF